MGIVEPARRAEALLQQCLEQPEADWAQAVQAACAAHPEVAGILREMFETLVSGGLGAGRSEPVHVGRYRLIRPLGSGGMGTVFLAEATPGDGQQDCGPAPGQRVALKLIRHEQSMFSIIRDRFRREIAVLRKLTHPAIVRVLDAGEHDGMLFYAMDLVAGRTLADALATLGMGESGSLSGADLARVVGTGSDCFPRGWVETCVGLLRQVAEALAHAHAHGVLHRDIKPSNIMIGVDGRPILIDFGLAADIGADRLTRTGAHVGSLPYMAPELVRGGASAATEQTDVYALGVTFFELLTLSVPFLGGSEYSVRRRIVSGDVPPIRVGRVSISGDIERLCLAAMDPDPRWRLPTARALADDLGRISSLHPIVALRPGWWVLARRRCIRHPVRTAVAALGGLLALAIGAFLLQVQQTARVETIYRLEAEWQAGLGDLEIANDNYHEARRIEPLDPRWLPFVDAWIDQSSRLQRSLRGAGDRAKRLLDMHDLPQAPPLPAAGNARLGHWQSSTADEEKALSTAFLRIGCADSLFGTIQRHATVLREREVAANIESWSMFGDEARRAWGEFQSELSQDPAFRGLTVAPQLGLFPLGKNQATGRFAFWHVAMGGCPGRAALTSSEFRSGPVFELLPPEGSVERPFFLATKPLTRMQYARIRGLPWEDMPDPDAAAASMSWVEATRVLERYGMLLPTRAQWESGVRDRADGLLEWSMTRVEVAAAGRQSGMVQPLELAEREGVLGGDGVIRRNPDIASPRIGVRPAIAIQPERVPMVKTIFAGTSFAGWVGGFAGRRNSAADWIVRSEGGNPGSYVETVTCSGVAFCVLVDPDAVWDPATKGPWDSVVMSVQARCLSGWGPGSVLSPVVEQDGVFFFASDMRGAGATVEWHPFATVPLTPDRFFHCWPRDWDSMAEGPWGKGKSLDFSPDAKPMRFGFGVYAQSYGVYREAFGDWRVVIWSKPR